MHLIIIQRSIPKLKNIKVRYYSQPAVQNEAEYTETPNYPVIQDLSLQARKLRDRETLFEKIKKLKTVEEKQIALNMPTYYGFKCVILNENKVPFNALPMIKFYTRSHFIDTEHKLHDSYAGTESLAATAAKEIKGQIEDALAFELDGVKYTFESTIDTPLCQQEEDAVTRRIVKQINRIILNNLADRTSHLLNAQVDYDPRHEAFWFIGGVDPPANVVQFKRKFNWIKHRANEPVDRAVQYLGTPILTVRSSLPLNPVLPYSDIFNKEYEVPMFTYAPQVVGYNGIHRHGTNMPGFWPGDTEEFGLLSIHGRGHIKSRQQYFDEQDCLEALHCQAMKASFGWLLAQASYLGFNTYNDITYPLVTQTLITNGQYWSFYTYQLNTVTMHNDVVNDNRKNNLCFGTKPMKLYEKFENGKIVGLNEDVLKMILQVYSNTPEKRDYDMIPYLDKEERFIADIEDDNRRIWLENTYKHIVSNRPKHYLSSEIYDWERIYKIYFNTRFFEARRRPFELNQNPYKRRLDEHLPPYIPKCLRPYPKCRKKFETTYYPDV